SLRATSPNYTLVPETVSPEYPPNLTIVRGNGSFGEGIHDVTLIERHGLPATMLARSDHEDLFSFRIRDGVSHLIAFATPRYSGNAVPDSYALVSLVDLEKPEE